MKVGKDFEPYLPNLGDTLSRHFEMSQSTKHLTTWVRAGKNGFVLFIALVNFQYLISWVNFQVSGQFQYQI